MSQEVPNLKKTFWAAQGKEDLPFIPFSRPSFSEEALQEVMDCLKSGWITTGPRVQQFEKALGEFIGVPHVLSLTSATAGLYLALQALGIGERDEVITTPLTFAATVNVIALTGAKPVLIDVDSSYNMDLNLLEKAITSRTKAIIPVHFAGLPLNMEELNRLAQRYGLRVIEDAAHAIGTQCQGKKIGSFGDIQVFSFHATKNMTTGEGGALVTRDAALEKKISVLRFHGIDRPAWNRFSQKGSPHYDVIQPAIKFNMMDIQAALGIHQLPSLESFIDKRTLLAQRYHAAFQERPYVICPSQARVGDRHAWHLFAPLLNEKVARITRDDLLERLKEQQIGVSLHYRPVHLFSCYQKEYGFRTGDFPVAEKIGEQIFSLPLFPDLTFEEQDRIIATLDRIVEEA